MKKTIIFSNLIVVTLLILAILIYARSRKTGASNNSNMNTIENSTNIDNSAIVKLPP